jgi:hypothetical protein
MHVKDFAIAYPFTFLAGTALILGVNYFNVKGIGEIMTKYAALQQVKRDSKHLDKVLQEMRATSRVCNDQDDGESEN